MNVRTLSAALCVDAVMVILKTSWTPPNVWILMNAWRECLPALTASTPQEGKDWFQFIANDNIANDHCQLPSLPPLFSSCVVVDRSMNWECFLQAGDDK